MISGERCNPHPHVFSDRILRPGDPVLSRNENDPAGLARERAEVDGAIVGDVVAQDERRFPIQS